MRPAGANIRSFLIECLAGPLVGMDPKHVHVFCDMYEHARHSYKKFGQLEFNNYINILSELKNLVLQNTQNKPDPSKKSGTPNHNKPVNRPRKRIGSTQNVSMSMYNLNFVKQVGRKWILMVMIFLLPAEFQWRSYGGHSQKLFQGFTFSRTWG